MVKMKEDEPKVKYSQKYWEKNKVKLKCSFCLQGDAPTYSLSEEHKATYDRLVTLEAKIEVMKDLHIENPEDRREIHSQINEYESELAELVKELKI